MKTKAPLIFCRPWLKRYLKVLSNLTCLSITVLSISCQNNGAPPKTEEAKPVLRKHWVKVSSRPPTYYPRGVPSDCVTDHHSGEWVYTEDALGTRYFIPLRGVRKTPRQTLVQEALAARSKKKLDQIAAGNRPVDGGKAAQTVGLGSLVVMGQAMRLLYGTKSIGEMDYSEDYANFEQEWHRCKKPKW